MTSKEIAHKYVYFEHDALTDRQEVKDMAVDIKQHSLDFYMFMQDNYRQMSDVYVQKLSKNEAERILITIDAAYKLYEKQK